MLLLGPALPRLGDGVGLPDLLGGLIGQRPGRGAHRARERHAQGPNLMLDREGATGAGAGAGAVKAGSDSSSTVGRWIRMDHKEDLCRRYGTRGCGRRRGTTADSVWRADLGVS